MVLHGKETSSQASPNFCPAVRQLADPTDSVKPLTITEERPPFPLASKQGPLAFAENVLSIYRTADFPNAAMIIKVLENRCMAAPASLSRRPTISNNFGGSQRHRRSTADDDESATSERNRRLPPRCFPFRHASLSAQNFAADCAGKEQAHNEISASEV
jgi:hypothetical protein